MPSLFISENQAKTLTTQPGYLKENGFWIFLMLTGFLLPVLLYGLLPAMGVDLPARLFSLKVIALLLVVGITGVGYFFYFKQVLKKPHWLVFFMLFAWEILNYGNDSLMLFGFNIRFRLLMTLIFTLPGTCLVALHLKTLIQSVPQFKYYLIFFSWLTFYFFFYNTHAIDPEFMGGDGVTAGSVDIIQITGYYYGFLAIALSAIAVREHQAPSVYFDFLNKGLFIVTGLISLYTMIGYPLLLTSEWIDGFQRANGLFSHPNPFAHQMGIILLYQFGMVLYYQGKNITRMSSFLLLSSAGLNVIAFLLAMSKTAIGIFILCGLVLFLLNLSSPLIQRHLAKIALAALLIVPTGIFMYEAVTDRSFISVLESRLDMQDSMVWRRQIWEYLLSNIHGTWILIGHGFTDSNAWVYHLTYNTETNSKPLIMVHNGYIALLYDLGVMGLFFFVAALAQLKNSLKHAFTQSLDKAIDRPLQATVVCLSLYFLVVCGFDEMTYMFNAPIFFWCLTSTLFCLLVNEKSAKEKASVLHG